MIGDRLVFKKRHFDCRNTIAPVLAEQYEQKKSKLIATIGGASGTGKSETSILTQEKLWEEYGIRSYLISLDDYYLTPWTSRDEIRKQKGISSVGIHEIDWEKVEDICNNFRNEAYTYLYPQRIHKFINSFEECKIERAAIDILILEGLYANYLGIKDYGVYLEGNYKDTLKFRKERNKEIRNAWRKRVLKKEQTEVIKTKDKADLIIPFKS